MKPRMPTSTNVAATAMATVRTVDRSATPAVLCVDLLTMEIASLEGCQREDAHRVTPQTHRRAWTHPEGSALAVRGAADRVADPVHDRECRAESQVGLRRLGAGVRAGRCDGLGGADHAGEGAQPSRRYVLAQLGELVALLVPRVLEHRLAQHQDPQ